MCGRLFIQARSTLHAGLRGGMRHGVTHRNHAARRTSKDAAWEGPSRKARKGGTPRLGVQGYADPRTVSHHLAWAAWQSKFDDLNY